MHRSGRRCRSAAGALRAGLLPTSPFAADQGAQAGWRPRDRHHPEPRQVSQGHCPPKSAPVCRCQPAVGASLPPLVRHVSPEAPEGARWHPPRAPPHGRACCAPWVRFLLVLTTPKMPAGPTTAACSAPSLTSAPPTGCVRRHPLAASLLCPRLFYLPCRPGCLYSRTPCALHGVRQNRPWLLPPPLLQERRDVRIFQ